MSSTERLVRARRVAVWAALLALASGCSSRSSDHHGASDGGLALPSASAPPEPTTAPTAQEPLEELDAGEEPTEPQPPQEGPRCSPDMVRVARRFCIDRYEGSLVDAVTGQTISPYYPPTRKQAGFVEKLWEKQRLETGNDEARDMPLPILPAWEKTHDIVPRAVSKKEVVPQGYVSGELADVACKNAGKRLCTIDEWRTACRGEANRQYPYGTTYEEGKCNIFREGHPAAILHNNASIGHTDPRLNLVRVNGRPLLRRTGETKSCQSSWEGDAIADMVGNIDEWIDDPEGTFAGGFYARNRKGGCDETISTHGYDYFDYSTGIRCCMDLPR